MDIEKLIQQAKQIVSAENVKSKIHNFTKQYTITEIIAKSKEYKTIEKTEKTQVNIEIENIFHIKDHNEYLEINSEKDYKDFISKIDATCEFEELINKYKDDKGFEKYIGIIGKIKREYGKIKNIPEYDEDEYDENLHNLKEYVFDKIFKHIKKILTSLHYDVKNNEFALEMLKFINSYLKTLKIYTITLEIGDNFKNQENSIYYKVLQVDDNVKFEDLKVLDVKRLAYSCRYKEEDDIIKHYVEGECTCQ